MSLNNKPEKARQFEFKGLTIRVFQEQLAKERWVEIGVFEGLVHNRNIHRFLDGTLLRVFSWEWDMILDISALGYEEKIGLGALLSIFFQIKKSYHKKVALCGLEPDIEEAVNLSGRQILKDRNTPLLVFDSIEDAKKALT